MGWIGLLADMVKWQNTNCKIEYREKHNKDDEK